MGFAVNQLPKADFTGDSNDCGWSSDELASNSIRFSPHVAAGHRCV
jgi:hypothetical protein